MALEEGGVEIGPEFTLEENVYLIADSVDRQADMETLLEPYYEAIFAEELGPGIGLKPTGRVGAT